MRHFALVPIAGSTALALSFLGPALSYEVGVPPAEIIGRICTTAGGATFTFTNDGHYATMACGRTPGTIPLAWAQ
jgi:hypothetical protein